MFLEFKKTLTAGLIRAGGVLTSLYNTSQQWDSPNAWPCLQFFIVEGLNTYGGRSSSADQVYS